MAAAAAAKSGSLLRLSSTNWSASPFDVTAARATSRSLKKAAVRDGRHEDNAVVL